MVQQLVAINYLLMYAITSLVIITPVCIRHTNMVTCVYEIKDGIEKHKSYFVGDFRYCPANLQSLKQ